MKINTHTSHPSVFISSTFADLESERRAVAKVLSGSNINVNALDIKPASNDSSRSEILRGIKESDFVILIVGERYGSILPKLTSSSRLSVTQWEYLQAINIYGKHVLVYFKRVKSKDQINFDDYGSPDYKLKREQLKRFKQRLGERHNPKYVETVEELVAEVKSALIPTYRSGVLELTRKLSNKVNEVESLRSENEQYKAMLNAMNDQRNKFSPNPPNLLSRPPGLGLLSPPTENDSQPKGLLGPALGLRKK